MNDFLIGLTFVIATIALVLSYVAYRHVKRVVQIVHGRNSSVVMVDTQNDTVTVIREFKKPLETATLI